MGETIVSRSYAIQCFLTNIPSLYPSAAQVDRAASPQGEFSLSADKGMSVVSRSYVDSEAETYLLEGTAEAKD